MGQDLGSVSELLLSLRQSYPSLLRMPSRSNLAIVLFRGIIPGSLHCLQLGPDFIPDSSLVGCNYGMLASSVIQYLLAQNRH